MIFLATIGGIALAFGFAWAMGEVLVLAFERKVKRIIKKCKKAWREDSLRLKEKYVSEENYITETVEELLRKSELIEKEEGV